MSRLYFTYACFIHPTLKCLRPRKHITTPYTCTCLHDSGFDLNGFHLERLGVMRAQIHHFCGLEDLSRGLKASIPNVAAKMVNRMNERKVNFILFMLMHVTGPPPPFGFD